MSRAGRSHIVATALLSSFRTTEVRHSTMTWEHKAGEMKEEGTKEMPRTVEKESKPVGVADTNFWQGKKVCWEMCHCPEVIKSECPAPRYPSFPCWEIEGTYCKLTPDGTGGQDTSICHFCRVYKRWGENKPIELKLFGKGINSFRKFLDEKARGLALPQNVVAPANSALLGERASTFPNTFRRRPEMYPQKLNEILDRHNGEQGALTKILKDIQDEYEWLPREVLDHVSQRLEVPTTKLYRMAIFGKGLSIIPRIHQVDGNVCVVDLVKYYLDFLQHDLCGKCLPCREGMYRMYQIVRDITRGEAQEKDLELLKEVARWVAELSACNQGTIVANIILAALEDFQWQFQEHLNGVGCPTAVCASL